jgi:two-component system cell cycle sensor histidine kinase PleC
MFLACGVMTVIATQMVSRGNNMTMYVASLAPLTLMASARFLTSDLSSDMILGGLAPLLILQLCYNSWPLMARMDEDLRLRFRVEDMAGALGMARDEALRKRFEAETANASKTAFLANMSHELRTPLNAILGFSELLASPIGDKDPAKVHDYAEMIHSSGRHLLMLINDILDLAKIEAGHWTLEEAEVDLFTLAQDTLSLLAWRAKGNGAEIHNTIAPNVSYLYADERAIKQILLNLLSNAAKFTPAQGRITVFARQCDDGAMIFGVEDSGIGIAPEDQAHIFDSFGQGKHDITLIEKGTGLGLAIVKGLAEVHGGHVQLSSEPGRGTCVQVRMPSERLRPRREKLAHAG